LETTGIFELDSELWSVFAQATWNINEQFRITGGVRYTDEEKGVLRDSRCNFGIISAQLLIPFANALCPDPVLDGFTDERSSDNVMPEVSGQWYVTEDFMLYAKWGESAKSGGFASATSVAPSDLEYGDEDATGYEVGFKSRWFDGRAELNVTWYRTEFKDLQVNSFRVVDLGGGLIQTIPTIKNAAEAVSEGVEVDGRWAPTDWLTLGGSFAYLDAEYESFRQGQCNTVNATPTGICDLSGQRLPLAAEWSGNVYADFQYPISGNINLVAYLGVAFSDEYTTDGSLDPAGLQDSWTKVNARFGVADANDRWSLAIVGRNLTEEDVLSTTQPFGTYFLGYLEPPRTILLQGSYRFGD
jgi:outer membrane receptor protein involved in Fe transport